MRSQRLGFLQQQQDEQQLSAQPQDGSQQLSAHPQAGSQQLSSAQPQAGSQQLSAQPQAGSQQLSAQPQVGSQQHFLAAQRARSRANRPAFFLQQQLQQGSQQLSAQPQDGSQQPSAHPQAGSQQLSAQPQAGSQQPQLGSLHPPNRPKNAFAFEAPLSAMATLKPSVDKRRWFLIGKAPLKGETLWLPCLPNRARPHVI
jgi:hypothetical protein